MTVTVTLDNFDRLIHPEEILLIIHGDVYQVESVGYEGSKFIFVFWTEASSVLVSAAGSHHSEHAGWRNDFIIPWHDICH